MKQFVRGLCTVLAACLLAGCAPAHVEYVTVIPKVDAPWDARQNPEGGQPTARPASTAQDLTNVYGSALLLGWPCVLYSIYLDTPEGDAWTEETLAQTRRNLTVAVDWITRQAEAYRAVPRLYYDQGEGDLTAFVSCPVELTEDATSGNDFYDYVDTLTAAVDTDAIARAYGTSSIGYLIFVPAAGCSYSILHYLEDGEYYLNEFSCLYLYDVYEDPGTFEGPAVYAHEILHLFGASDLYEDSSDVYVTPELTGYVARQWPDAIMYYTYNDDNSISYDHIEKTICPLTAYRLGLCDTFPGIERFPGAAADPPGTYSAEPGGSGRDLGFLLDGVAA